MTPRLRFLPAAALTALAALAALAAPLWAVQPSARLAHTPTDVGLAFDTVTLPAAGDSAQLQGWWIAGPPHAPVVVMAGPGTENRAVLLPLARRFHDRGLTLLLFDYRDFGPTGVGPTDTLRDLVMTSRWVDDAMGALRFAREHADSGARVVVGWGQEMGSAIMLAALGRDLHLADGLVLDNLFHDTETLMRWNGTSVIPDAVTRQHQLLRLNDEPVSASGRLRVPLLLTLAGREESAPPDVSDGLFTHPKSRVDRWLAPQATRAQLTETPGYVDRVVSWVQWIYKAQALR